MVRIMGRINTAKMTYNKEHYSHIEKREDLHVLYGSKNDIKRRSGKPRVVLCTLKRTPIRSN